MSEPKESKGTALAYDQTIFDQYEDRKPYPVGARTSHTLRSDPRHILFSLSRYKFCAKMLEGMHSVLEVGCGDAFGAPIVLQTVGKLHCIDLEPQAIEANIRMNEYVGRLSFEALDLAEARPSGTFDAVFSMDVLEHVPPEREQRFLENMAACLPPHGVCILGTPNIAAEQHASPLSHLGHVNLKSHKTLRASMETYFHNVFLFSVNDEVVHTGYAPMAHFLIALCAGRR